MNKVKLSWGKFPLVTVLSLGFMVLGIGCISWAMFSISRYSIPTAFAAEQNMLTGDTSAPVEPDPSLVLPASDKTLYPVYPAGGDTIGSLTIPALNRKLPILQGTGVEELKKGVGHFNQSVLPGEKDNCVFSGHRETVFRQIGNLKIGDPLIVQTSAGTFTYEVNGTRIVHADDKTVIVPTDHAVLTLTTCYPFYTPGYFPDRYIVSATLVKSK
ncbi:MAG: class D sortase [Desulfitobacteriaceae bacterium]